MSFKIVHLVNDEKFIKFIADIFNNCDGVTNRFIVLVSDSSVALRHVSNLSNIRIIANKEIFFAAIKKELLSCDTVIIHFNDPIKMVITLRSPKKVPVVWSGWGLDYCNYIANCSGTTLGVESTELQSSLLKKKQKHKNLLCYYTKTAIDFFRNPIKNFIFKRFLDRVNYFSSPVPEDFELLKLSLGDKFKATFVQINYGSVDKTFAPGPEKFTGDDILVGNSATSTNNHLEIFRLLSSLDLGDRKIIVPLSYGNSYYRDEIIKNGYKFFGEKFNPLVDFMPLENYNKIIANCSVIVMGHRRQQAVGNTATMLYKGAKVFLDESSTVYRFFKKRGAFIFSLNDLIECRPEIFLPLSSVQQRINREIIQCFWGDDVVQHNVNILVEKLKSHIRSANV